MTDDVHCQCFAQETRTCYKPIRHPQPKTKSTTLNTDSSKLAEQQEIQRHTGLCWQYWLCWSLAFIDKHKSTAFTWSTKIRFRSWVCSDNASDTRPYWLKNSGAISIRRRRKASRFHLASVHEVLPVFGTECWNWMSLFFSHYFSLETWLVERIGRSISL